MLSGSGEKEPRAGPPAPAAPVPGLRCRFLIRSAVRFQRPEPVAMAGVGPLPATPLRGFRRPLLGQGEVGKADLEFAVDSQVEVALMTSPCPRGGRRAPKERDGRGATPDRTDARVVLRSEGGRTNCFGLGLDESASALCRVLDLSRRHRCAALADLSSDKERLGFEDRFVGMSAKIVDDVCFAELRGRSGVVHLELCSGVTSS